MRKAIHNDETKEPFRPLPGGRLPLQTMRGDFKAKVALEAIREEMTMAELSKTVWCTSHPDRHMETRSD
ncbi:MAG: hypothetical protein COB08_007850 [Rhodobacteraceae bacterium]|nr:hypothetical protein [Paracoccaceae bacterium]